jgi:hypothetical protein
VSVADLAMRNGVDRTACCSDDLAGTNRIYVRSGPMLRSRFTYGGALNGGGQFAAGRLPILNGQDSFFPNGLWCQIVKPGPVAK